MLWFIEFTKISFTLFHDILLTLIIISWPGTLPFSAWEEKAMLVLMFIWLSWLCQWLMCYHWSSCSRADSSAVLHNCVFMTAALISQNTKDHIDKQNHVKSDTYAHQLHSQCKTILQWSILNPVNPSFGLELKWLVNSSIDRKLSGNNINNGLIIKLIFEVLVKISIYADCLLY